MKFKTPAMVAIDKVFYVDAYNLVSFFEWNDRLSNARKFVGDFDSFYLNRKGWKVITKDFCGQIVQNIGKELE